MTTIFAAVVTVLGTLALFALKQSAANRSARREADAEAARARGAVYEDFVTAIFRVAQGLHFASDISRRAILPPRSASVRDAIKRMTDAHDASLHVHTRLRTVAPDDVMAAADDVLDVIARAAGLLQNHWLDRRRHTRAWDAVWSELRERRIEFERLARADASSA